MFGWEIIENHKTLFAHRHTRENNNARSGCTVDGIKKGLEIGSIDYAMIVIFTHTYTQCTGWAVRCILSVRLLRAWHFDVFSPSIFKINWLKSFYFLKYTSKIKAPQTRFKFICIGYGLHKCARFTVRIKHVTGVFWWCRKKSKYKICRYLPIIFYIYTLYLSLWFM